VGIGGRDNENAAGTNARLGDHTAMHESSLLKMEKFVETHLSGHRGRRLRIVDIGSMDVNGTYQPLFDDPLWEYTGVDMEPGPGVTAVLPNPYNWGNLRPGSFDVAISGQAFEHFEFPWVSVLNVTRILAEGGLFCMIVPSRGFEHRYPLDCWRYYPDGALALGRWGDLEPLSVETTWEAEPGAPDGAAQWGDTMLVARKPVYANPARRQLARLRRWVLISVLSAHARRRSAL
jgi:SAM-dependent methyltransferase